jgi:hypothetical protein
MTQKHETRGARRSRAPLVSAVAADLGDDTETLLASQASWLCRRFGTSPALAAVVAELAFTRGHAMIIPLNLKPKRPEPDAVSVAFNLGRWGAVFTPGGRVRFLRSFTSREVAQVEVGRLVQEEGLTRREPEGAPRG